MQLQIGMASLLFFTSADYIIKNRLRVIEGRDSHPDEYPYIVSIETIRNKKSAVITSRRSCTGSLLAAAWVLTAAHCQVATEEDSRIRYGDMTLPQKETNSYRNVLKYVPNPSYRTAPDIINGDIMLIFIEEILLKEYAIVSAIEYSTLIGLPVLYVGFGEMVRTEKSTVDDDNKPLQVGEGGIIPCEERGFLSVVCVVAKCSHREQSPYVGDSGGPLLHEGRVVAVCSGVSTWHVLAYYEMMFQYTPVSPFVAWIEREIRIGNS